MPVDWLVLATPLVTLPLILLFAFVGCALDREGAGVVLSLHYQSGLELDVKTITVTFTYTVPPKPAEGVEIGNKGYTVTLDPITVDHKSIKPAGDSVSWLPQDLDIPDISSVTCACIVTTSADPSDDSIPGTPEVPSGSPNSKVKPEDEHVAEFFLTRLGAGYVVS